MSNLRKPKIMVGLSGGVDSSVAAMLLLEQGYAVEAMFMKNWNDDDGTEYCTAREDLMDAMQVAQQLGIELHTVNFSEAYWDRVFAHFLSEYRAGRTPNPDILCNKEIKFRAFIDYAQSLGADQIATGHYAKLQRTDSTTLLLKGVDANKDQSYFLHAVASEKLQAALFPLGDLTKPEVRKLAAARGLATKDKKDSTGICFIGERKFKDFLEKYLPAQPGDIVTIDGHRMGKHSGLMYHTIGQRQGLGIGGVKGASDEPWYVVDKNISNNQLLVAQGDHHPALYKKCLSASQASWVNGPPSSTQFQCAAKIRYRQSDQPCAVTIVEENIIVEFDEPQRAVTPGQSIVFYQGNVCLGGAVIDSGFTAIDNSGTTNAAMDRTATDSARNESARL